MRKSTENRTPEPNPPLARSVAQATRELRADEPETKPISRLTIAALGVVYGDIGTSPLYAFRQCFHGNLGLPVTTANVIGILSLIVWSLILVVSIKYLLFILRADNRGEGGIIALVALLNPWRSGRGSQRYFLMLAGLFGAALLYGDGMITPAISVLSAVEGLNVATGAFEPYIIPITVAVLIALFVAQNHGTSRIGALFGPIMLVWFLVLGGLGLNQILSNTRILAALDPGYAIGFLAKNGIVGFVTLGTVFLVVTGGETLYADLGHFGRRPIRLAWFFLVLPALLLNYFGQGALVLSDMREIDHPFFHLAPARELYALVGVATLATIIASQAVISGTFSLTRQAVQLDQLPRMTILQTDREHIGQIYIPVINWILMAATIGLVLAFRSSENLAAAYGLAVSMDMVITTTLAYFVARRWGWNPIVAGLLAVAFAVVDLSFLGANLFKFTDGGWFPVLVATAVFALMGAWRGGQRQLIEQQSEVRENMDAVIERILAGRVPRVPGTAIFLTSSTNEAPPLLLHHLEHNKALHERVILLTVATGDEPRVPTAERLELHPLSEGFERLIVHYGFMQSPNVAVALRLCSRLGLNVEPDEATFYIGHEDVVPAAGVSWLARARTLLYAFLARNEAPATKFFGLPPERVVEIGTQVIV